MLTINHLTASHNRKPFLKVNSLQVMSGEIVAIVGPNGSGKTTLLNTLSTTANSINDIELHYKPLSVWPRLRLAQHLAVLPQHHQLSFPFTVTEVVEMGATPLTLKGRELAKEVNYWLTFTDTSQLANKLYPQLSGGEKQRVHLARVLLQLSQAQQPPILLLDEPTSAQDLGQQHAMLTKLQQLAKQQNFMIVMILHDLNQVTRYCDTVWLMQNGKVIADNTPETILTPEIIENVWRYRPKQINTSQGAILF